jgi:hypothetical protein
MKKSGPILIYFLTGLLLIAYLPAGCEKNLFFRTEPELTEKTILDSFTEVSINDIFQVELRNDSVYSIQLTGKKSILERISFQVNGNILELHDRNSRQWMPGYPVVKLIISFPDISVISLNAPGELFSSDTLKVNSLLLLSRGQLTEMDLTLKSSHLFLVTGTDDFSYYTLRGFSENTDLRVYGSAQLRAGGLKAENVSIRNISIGDCYIYAEKQLRVWLEHYGNVFYSGSPDEIIIETMTSRGRLIEKTD